MSYECHIILDFEFNPVASQNRDIVRDEIIEIGAIKLNPQFEEIGRLTCLVKPELHSFIDPKITKLTGIRTEDVENAVPFETAIEMLSDWIGPAKNRVYSWSDNDLWQLVDECNAKGVEFPANMYRWMDLQKVFQRVIGYPHRQCMALSYAANMLRIDFDKSHAHRAIYDTEATAEILRRLKSPDYQLDLARAKQTFCKSPQRMTYSIGSACRISLLQLMEKLA